MPDQRYDANRFTIGSLLSTATPKIVVPDWQRSYSWTGVELEAFWLDLLAFDRSYPDNNVQNQEYFLGSAVLVTGGAANLLLDGQQRLATATILLSVLRDSRSTFKSDAAERLQSKYIADFDDATSQTTPVLTLNTYDRDFFRDEVQAWGTGDKTAPTPKLKSHALIRKARDYFREQLDAESKAAGGGEAAFRRNLRIGMVLCDHMSIVVVSSTDEDNAASVFETLNDRGIGLSTPDLLRNLLLRRAAEGDHRRRVVAAWQTILGISDEANVDEFLRHYWVSIYGDVKSRKLYREIKDTVIGTGLDSVELSESLAEAAAVYRELVTGVSAESPELRRRLLSIKELGAKVLYPALLSGHAAQTPTQSAAVAPVVAGADQQPQAPAEKPKHGLNDLATALVTLFVRHNVIGGKESTALESTVFGVASSLRKDGDFTKAVTTLRALAPDLASFETSFSRTSISRIATARYLLREIEHDIRSTGELAVESPDRVHVEHIYPQTPPAGERWGNHAQLINRLGNLTLLGKRLNTSVKNANFAIKKEKAYKGSDILMTKKLCDVATWDGKQIEVRQADLAKRAATIWAFPGEVQGSSTIARTSETAVDREGELEELPEVPEAEGAEDTEVAP